MCISTELQLWEGFVPLRLMPSMYDSDGRLQMKTCFKCGEYKPLSDYYKHSRMADGHLNKCKECTRSDTKKNRNDRIDYYREYDRDRGNRQSIEYRQKYAKDHPKACKARNAVSNAVRDGRMEKKPCEVCGTTVRLHAHHDDYSKPLDVRWLCAAHHRQWHIEHGECK